MLKAHRFFLSISNSLQIIFDADETGDFILRLQPALYKSVSYTLSISAGPSLDFPVSDNKASIGSFWGDGRDGGKRSHEGIDIFAAKHSSAIASADGYVTGVKEGGIGGKTVWLRPEGKNYTLYYAHLDKQLVREGEFVKKGSTIGLVGNTGNAKYTASHLHFGIYTNSGAIDPLPFVNRNVKIAAEVPTRNLATSMKLIKSKKSGDELIKPNTILVPLAVTAEGYIVELPNGKPIQLSFDDVKRIGQETKNALAKQPTNPDSKKS